MGGNGGGAGGNGGIAVNAYASWDPVNALGKLT